MAKPDEKFLKRWSRLKRDDGPAPAGPGHDASEGGAGSPPAAPEADSGDTPPPPDLPDIESLDKDSDYTVFLKDGVPEELRKLALRALWRSDPVLANLDGLNDYDEDFGAAMRIGAEAMRKLAAAEERLAGDDETAPDSGETVAGEADGDATDTPDSAETPGDEPVQQVVEGDDDDDEGESTG